MKKQNITLFRITLAWLVATPVFAQTVSTKPFRLAIIETFVTGFPLDNYGDPSTGTAFAFFENAAHIGIMTNLSEHWRAGLNYNYLWTKYNKQLIGTFFIAGLNVRYERSISKKFNMYADVLLQTGNYCPCLKDLSNPDEFPYKQDNRWYSGFGIGMNYKIYKALRINIAVNRYMILGSKVYSYDYAQPFVGLQWYIQ
jgi:hypothetical protein